MVDLIALTQAMQAAVPTVVSVSVPDPNNKATWVVQCDPPADVPTQAAIQAAIQAFNPTTVNNAAARQATFVAQPDRQDLLTRLQTATPAQIDNWLTTNVTTLAQARTVLGALIKIVAASPPSV